MGMPAGSKQLHTRHLAKQGPTAWIYVMTAVIGAFAGSLIDIALWEGRYLATFAGAIVLPLLAYVVGHAWGRRQVQAELVAQAREEEYRKRVVAERAARLRMEEERRRELAGPDGERTC